MPLVAVEAEPAPAEFTAFNEIEYCVLATRLLMVKGLLVWAGEKAVKVPLLPLVEY